MRADGVLPEIRGLVEGISPLDEVEEGHRRQALRWLSRTDDVFRRAEPRTPAQHLVSYFLLVDPDGPHFLLVDHIKAGRWLPTGGHVDTVGPPDERHTDVSLWFVLTGQREQVLQPDHVEFHSVRWWSGSEVTASDPSLFDPHLARMLTKVHQILRTP